MICWHVRRSYPRGAICWRLFGGWRRAARSAAGASCRDSWASSLRSPGAIELLRSVRKTESTGESLQVTAADPLNLVGIVTPGPRVSTLAGVVVNVLGQNSGNLELGTGHWELSSNV